MVARIAPALDTRPTLQKLKKTRLMVAVAAVLQIPEYSTAVRRQPQVRNL